jgi:putative DNA primase/helicase
MMVAAPKKIKPARRLPARFAKHHSCRNECGSEERVARKADGKLRRFASNGKGGDDAGWYILHDDNIPAGAFGDWRTGVEQTWRANIGRKLTFAEAEALKRKADAARKQREAEQARSRQEAQDRARAQWKAAHHASDHVYLQRKRVKAHGLRISGDRLLVPMYDAAGVLHSLQFIDAEGEKRYLTGGLKNGCYFPIGKPNGLLCIAEGYATAASIHQATGHAVAVAFDAGNLEPVALAMREKHPALRIVLCADDDYATSGNPGLARASDAARAVGGLVAVPDFGADRPEDATDFNDLAVHRGAEAVKQAIANARPPEKAQEVSAPQPAAPSATEADLSVRNWPDPAALPAELPAVEAFALELLPDALRPWITDVAERVQCPPEFPAVAAMVALGSVLGRRVAVLPKKQDNWYEYPNLWGAIIGRPGVLKSPALHEALRPLRELEREAAEAHAPEIDAWKERKASAAIRREASKANARKAAIKGNTFDVAGIIADDTEEEPALRRHVVNDASIEALGEVLRGNPNGTLIYQDELIGLLRQLEREGNEAARGFYLTAWNGKEGYTFDRIGRGLNRRIDGVCLSLLGSIQPFVIGEYLREATIGGGADGLAARFSLMVWPDVSGDWRNVDRFPDTAARDAATEIFRRFDALTPEASGAEQPFDGVSALRFDEAAQADFDAWRAEFERTQRASEDHPAIITHREKYRKLVPAVALICHLADEPAGGGIGQRSLLRALAWLDYLDSHARRAYASVMRPDADGARELLKRIRRGELPRRFRLRDVYRNGWSRLCDREHARGAARMLVDFDYLAEADEVTGGRPTSSYDVNPKALA